jgi:hypothetical protein
MAGKKETHERASDVRLGDLYELLRYEPHETWGTPMWYLRSKCVQGDLLMVNWIDSWPNPTSYSTIEVSSGMTIVIPRSLGVHCRAWEKMVKKKKIKLLQRAG